MLHAEFHSFVPYFEGETTGKLESHLHVSRLPLRYMVTFRDIHGPGIPGPCMSIVTLALSTQSDFVVAISTIDRPAVGRLKRHFSVYAALGAYGRKHLAWETVAVTATCIPLCLPCLAA